MTFEKIKDVAIVTPGTSPKGDLINSNGLGLPFFQGSKEFTELYPVPERYTEYPVKVASSGDVLISVRAPVGEVNIAREDCSIGRGVMSVRAKKKSEQLFIFYFLKGLQGKWDSMGSTGSVFENLSTVALNNVDIPSGIRREVIGEILFTIDQKIAMNNALSKTLEDIAQAIFKSWFIDFDPVKAKMAREKPTGMDAATAALFPDSMEESELGLIPKGWNVAGLNEFAKPRKELAKVSSLDSQTNYVGLEHLPRNSLFFRTWSSAEKVQSGKSVFNPNDILFGKLRPYFHKVVVSPVAGVCSTDIVVIQSLDSKIDPYTASLVNQDEFIAFVTNRSSGTRMPRTSWQEMCEFKIAFPGFELMHKFNELMTPLFSFAMAAGLESNCFDNIREALLPRLISGELQIPDEMLAS